ncbi:hypothetical protein [Opitutus terrae]|nr:hypothetical protein [Opitutus terrae]
MQKHPRLQLALRWTALLVTLVGVGIWAGTGARLGWTQTSVVAMQRDDVTGIDYPVRQPAFIAGVEVPLVATAAAMSLVAASFALRRRAQRAA